MVPIEESLDAAQIYIGRIVLSSSSMPTPLPKRPEFCTTVTRAAITILETISMVTSALGTMIRETFAVHTCMTSEAVE
jgi:hypothetical protein